MPTIKINVPDVIDLSIFTLPKGAEGRAESKRTVQLKPGAMHASVLEQLFEYGARRWVNDRNAGSEGDEKFRGVSGLAIAMNDGQDIVTITGKQPRASKPGADPVTVRARQLVRKALKARLDSAKYKATFTDADPADQIAALDAIIEKNPSIVEDAKAELAAEAKIADGLVL